jgi:LysR family glycine cleavage system transcriptional activator
MPRLPTLKSIQAFEAVARHLSFKKAAEELNVTPTALSHQVKHLEDQLGVALFHRLTRSIKLTAEGEAYAPQVTAAFEKLVGASSLLDGDRLDGTLTVTTAGSFASSWLSPRIKGFGRQYPGISVRLLSSDSVFNFNADDVDLAIRFAAAPPQNMHAVWLLDDYVTLVCSPARPQS